jgi:PHD/YefM family antitoxin component YafN of YafNO toxin-antitoxin module
MVDAAGGGNISGDTVAGLFVNHECPAGMDAGSMGTRHQVGVCPESMVLDYGHIQDVHLVAGADSDLAFALGPSIEEGNIMKDYMVPVSEARGNLHALIKKVSMQKHFIITRNGKAEAVMLTPEELETLEIKADKKLLQSILRAEEDIQKDRLYSHSEVFKNV